MTAEQVLVWCAVGLLAGALASDVVGEEFGVAGGIVIGIAGAVLGSLLFNSLGWHAPFGGPAGVITVAFTGSVLLLLGLWVVRRRTVGART